MACKTYLIAFLAVLSYGQPRLTLSSGPVLAGQPATLTISLSGSVDVAALQFFLPLDLPVTAAPGMATVASGKTLTCAQSGGEYGCIVSGGVSLLADGPVAVLTLQPVGPLALGLVRLLGVNPAGDSPGISITAGPVLTWPVSRRNSIR